MQSVTSTTFISDGPLTGRSRLGIRSHGPRPLLPLRFPRCHHHRYVRNLARRAVALRLHDADRHADIARSTAAHGKGSRLLNNTAPTLQKHICTRRRTLPVRFLCQHDRPCVLRAALFHKHCRWKRSRAAIGAGTCLRSFETVIETTRSSDFHFLTICHTVITSSLHAWFLLWENRDHSVGNVVAACTVQAVHLLVTTSA